MLRARQQRRRDAKKIPLLLGAFARKNKYLEEEKFKLDFTAGLSAAADRQASR